MWKENWGICGITSPTHRVLSREQLFETNRRSWSTQNSMCQKYPHSAKTPPWTPWMGSVAPTGTRCPILNLTVLPTAKWMRMTFLKTTVIHMQMRVRLIRRLSGNTTIKLLDTPCAAGARSTSFHPAVDLNQRSISYVAARHYQNCLISACTRAWHRNKSGILFFKQFANSRICDGPKRVPGPAYPSR